METIVIKNRFNNETIFEHRCEENTIAKTVEAAVKAQVGLSDADLSGAYLRYANLGDTNLRRADLSGADLRHAYLSGAYLSGADLRRADLRHAYLSGADLSGADLRRADLRRADLRRADLNGADLSDADLSDADLHYADLSGANVDYSHGWTFSCLHSRFSADSKFFHQVLAHLCSLKPTDAEAVEIRKLILPYARKSHRVADLGII